MSLRSVGLAGPQTSQENGRPRFRERSCLERIAGEGWRMPDAFFWRQCASMCMLTLWCIHTPARTCAHTLTQTHADRLTYVYLYRKKKRVNGRTGIQLMDMMSKLTCMLEGDISVKGEREIWG